MGNKRWLTGLDFVRAAACIAILIYHMNITVLGAFAVTVFFILSGFLMTYNALASAQSDRPSLGGVHFLRSSAHRKALSGVSYLNGRPCAYAHLWYLFRRGQL